MTEQSFFNWLVAGWFVLAAVVFILLLFISAPYGRHSRRGWGPGIDNRPGWILMEAAAPIVFLACFLLGDNTITLTTLAFLALWEAHYVHRAFIYPLSLSRGAPVPVFIVGLGLIFNGVNAYLNGRYIFSFSAGYPNAWLADPRFVAGALMFVGGFIINREADKVLRKLRRPGDSGYSIPRGGFYRWISCPNYFGELVIWFGWALATWSLAGLSFAVWTAANLVPRARSHHAWYRETFPDYPPERKALLPGLW